MRSIAIVAGLFAVAALATPTPVKREEPCDDDAPPCLTYDQATVVANNFGSLISAYSVADANKYLTVDYTDYSDSVTELINGGCTGPQPLGAATFTSRASFEAGQGSQPDIPFQILNLWHTCDTVVIRWRTALTPEFVTGIIVMETTYEPNNAAEPFKINTVYSEFNSGAWLVDLGVFTPSCNTTSS